jgi:orotidine-5'-phosphate decarboxylase
MSRTEGPLDRVAFALDTPDQGEYLRWCHLFGPRVGYLKVGLEAFVRWGPSAVEEASRYGARIFLDLKLHDIPNTVAGAVGSAAELGVELLTVHSSGGSPALEAAVDAAGERLGILAVTLLTHLDAATLSELDLPGEGARRVERLARLARRSGCRGVVCSPLEVAALRRDNPPPFVLVTPGIRPSAVGRDDDQRRVATPASALADGSDLLVIGRPLTRSSDPGEALDDLERQLAAVAG